ncbi:armadillo-like helical domain-containing protein 3 [Saccoglossus kowalevskii]
MVMMDDNSHPKLLRQGSGSKMALKEKIVQIYEAFFKGEDPSRENPNFWEELFLLKANVQYLESELEKLTPKELLAMKALRVAKCFTSDALWSESMTRNLVMKTKSAMCSNFLPPWSDRLNRGSIILNVCRQFEVKHEPGSGGFFSAITNMVGSMFVTEDMNPEPVRANDSILLAMYEAVHLNRNFITVLTHNHTESTPSPPSPTQNKQHAVDAVAQGNGNA